MTGGLHAGIVSKSPTIYRLGIMPQPYMLFNSGDALKSVIDFLAIAGSVLNLLFEIVEIASGWSLVLARYSSPGH